MSQSPPPKLFPYITGLKGYAALGIFSVHVLRSLVEGNHRLYELVAFGRFGVFIFFVVSSYLIYHSVQKVQHFSFFPYLWKKIIRLAPLYISILCIVFISRIIFRIYPSNDQYFNQINNTTNILTHVLFLNFAPFFPQFAYSILNVEWTMPIQFWYFSLMPPVVLVIRKIPLFSIIFLGIGTLLYSSPNLLFPYTGYTNFSLERYFFPYVIGVIIYMMIGKINLLPSLQKRFTSNFPLISLFICFFLYAINPPYWNPELVVSVWIGLLLIVLSQPSILRTIVFENRIILFFGTISYPFYLLHYVVKDSISAYLSTSNQVIILILSLAITTLLGCFFHWIFEIWLVKKLRPKTYPAARS